ncbi:MAG: sulfatase-like hydrolase/transferase [Verrucomicrobiales bacterium]|nr:sulfatase-like hydrolase/transferase [Verrucomicrobiales bacterium]
MKLPLPVLLLVFALLCRDMEAAAQPPPNIVVIMADDLGYADIGVYGSRFAKTPHLDRLAAGGIRFTDFHSNGPMCTPTRAAFLTGLYQSRFGTKFEGALSKANDEVGLPLEALTIAEVLKQSGYVTGAFGKWHLGYQVPFLPTRQGFDEFRGLLSGDGDFHTRIDRSGSEDWYDGETIAMEPGYTTDLITRDSIDFIDRHQNTPFFLYVPHLAIHFPWQGPEDPPHREAGTDYGKDKWGVIPDRANVRPHVIAMIERLDDSVGEIVAALEERDLLENTFVIFTSDNGGYENYPGGFENISEMTPLRGQKGTIYEGGHRVPTIAFWPGRIAPSVCDATLMTMDLFPTFCAIVRAGHDELDGRDLSPILFNGDSIGDRDFFWRMRGSRAVRSGPWKLCLEGKKAPQLYHLGEDIGESTNLALAEPHQVKTLMKALAEWEADVDQSAKKFE